MMIFLLTGRSGVGRFQPAITRWAVAFPLYENDAFDMAVCRKSTAARRRLAQIMYEGLGIGPIPDKTKWRDPRRRELSQSAENLKG